MNIKDITEYGYYVDKQNTQVIEALKDTDEKGNEVLSIMFWNCFEIKDGIRFFETDMFALNPLNDDIADIEVEKLNQKFKIVDDNDPYYYQYGASSVMYEDKLSDSEKFKKIKKICEKSSKDYTVVYDDRGHTICVKDVQKLAKKILKVLEE